MLCAAEFDRWISFIESATIFGGGNSGGGGSIGAGSCRHRVAFAPSLPLLTAKAVAGGKGPGDNDGGDDGDDDDDDRSSSQSLRNCSAPSLPR